MNKKKILIIKTGAAGDVIRTTPLLHMPKGEVIWTTQQDNIPLLPIQHPSLNTAVDIGVAEKELATKNFDLIISLEEDKQCAQLASTLKTKKLVGIYWKNGKLQYTDDSREWFDMSLISRLGKKRADQLKLQNKKSYQEMLFTMLGYKFIGQEYILPEIKRSNNAQKIGIEKRVGSGWPCKAWSHYDELAEKLNKNGHKTMFLSQRENILDYLKDIASCSLILSADTLAMHLALGLKIPAIALFTCTSPSEIYDYGRLKKVISPKIKQAFYKKDSLPKISQTISLEDVFQLIKR